jgi:translocation and assembly module TamA
MDYFGASQEIPLNERFYAGGPNSVRGFEYQTVGPLDSDGDPLGGRFKLVWNVVELRRAVYRMIGVVGFFDLGNVWPDVAAVRLADIRSAAGVGLRANTPIGIVRLDYGVNLDPEAGEAARLVSFGMGQAF